MMRPMLIAAIMLSLAAAANAQSASNPLYSAWIGFEAGATVRYTGTSRTLGIETKIETTMKLLEKGGDKVVIEVSRKVTTQNDTVDEPPRRQEIKSTLPQNQAMTKIGDEEIWAAEKVYKCQVYQQQREQGDRQSQNLIILVNRYWLNEAVPGGIVKIDSKTEGQIGISTVIELKDIKP